MDKILDKIERSKPKDMFVAQNDPIVPKKKNEDFNPEKEMSIEERLKKVVMATLDDAEVMPLSDEYSKKIVIERLKEFKKDGITKRLPLSIFFTAPPE